jgi:hypothetical protein
VFVERRVVHLRTLYVRLRRQAPRGPRPSAAGARRPPACRRRRPPRYFTALSFYLCPNQVLGSSEPGFWIQPRRAPAAHPARVHSAPARRAGHHSLEKRALVFSESPVSHRRRAFGGAFWLGHSETLGVSSLLCFKQHSPRTSISLSPAVRAGGIDRASRGLSVRTPG